MSLSRILSNASVLIVSTAFATMHAGAAPAGAQRLDALRAACKTDSPSGAAVAGVRVRAYPAAAGDLPYHEAVSARSGAAVRIYHDDGLAPVAASKAGCLLGMLDLLAPAIPDTRHGIRWSSVVITADDRYLPPRTQGDTRWVRVLPDRSWDESATRYLLEVIPHEQAHLSQERATLPLPRWFREGHAEWTGLQVVQQVRPDLARQARAARAAASRKLGQAHLGAWGGMRVKPEAIERQISEEDRARRARDPGYTPSGSYSFGPDDVEQDLDNETGRYGAALALFDGLERRHGRAAVRGWAGAVLAASESAEIVALARELLGEDIAPLLE